MKNLISKATALVLLEYEETGFVFREHIDIATYKAIYLA